jgi:Right handed beta helix region
VTSAILFCWLAACGNGSPTGGTPPPGPPPPDDGLPPLPCPQSDRSASRVTYYVAIQEPGADNESCDGLSPVNRGGGNCPFKDFTSANTFRLLREASGVRVEVRAGAYGITSEGLTVSGSGNGGRAVLTAYQNESVVFDGEGIVREVLRVSGEGTTVERVTIQNSAAYNIEVRGGNDHIIQCNRFLQNVASDSLKGTGGASGTVVRDNEFSRWDSQAIDLTDVSDWTIVDNVFRDPMGVKANAIGAKFGARDVLIARNRFENTGGLSFGGVGSAHSDSFEAFRLVAEHNRLVNLDGQAVKFYSCSGCIFRDNDVDGAAGGIVLGGEQLEGPSGCVGGCRPTSGAVATGNRFRKMRGGAESGPGIFWGVYSTEVSGLSAGGNLYCHGSESESRFIFDGNVLDFAQWTRRLGTDGTSKGASEDEPVCNGW